MLVRRLLALLVAVGLVAAAVVVRARLDGGSGGGADAGSGAGTTADAATARVVCLRELAAVCGALDADGPAPVIEDAADTVERFAQRSQGVDAWVTVLPWPQLAADERARAGLPELQVATGPVLARSPVVLIGRTDRLAALDPVCGAARVSWPCIGEQAGQAWGDLGGDASWGRVEVGLDRPARTAGGLLTLAQATSAFFGGEPWNSRSLDTPAYVSWISGLGRTAGVPGGQSPLERMLLTGAAEYELTGAVEAPALSELDRAAGRAGQLEVRGIGPEVAAAVVVAGYGDAAASLAEQLGGQVAAPLADQSWLPADATTGDGGASSAAAPDDGLPTAAALEALRQLWIEVSRG